MSGWECAGRSVMREGENRVGGGSMNGEWLVFVGATERREVKEGVERWRGGERASEG